jgi:uncharacterized glyoxalase superfamily protein PhnB
MNEPRATFPGDTVMILQSAVPILSVGDLGAALEFYERVLGFDIEWKWGEPPHLASICRDRVEVNLSQLAPDSDPAISKVYFQMAGVDAYYLRVKTAGANVAIALADRPYGMRDFRVLDPSGNQLSFGEALPRAELEP